MPQKIIELAPVKESTADAERIEARVKKAFVEVLYGPLMAELVGDVALKNSLDDLLEAIRVGRITYDESSGVFRGKFSAAIAKELRKLGAKWQRGQGVYRLETGAVLPPPFRHALAVSSSRFEERLAAIDARIAKVLPENISEKIKLTEIFDRSLYKADKNIRKQLDSISVLPEISAEERRRVSEEWSTNLDRSIKDWTEAEILRLRRDVLKSVEAGNRYESMVSAIQRSYGVASAKAKFLARQETNLLMAKFKETRYARAGVVEYRWGCVAGSKLHPVRPAHKALEGKIFRWDTPPITTEPNEPQRRNNPGEDFNCRCFARPIIRFKDET